MSNASGQEGGIHPDGQVHTEASEVMFAQPQVAWLEIPVSSLTTGVGDQMSHRLNQDHLARVRARLISAALEAPALV